MASFVIVNSFAQALTEKVHDLSADALKLALTNDPMTAVKALFADFTEIAAGNGYTTGGPAVAVLAAAADGASWKIGLDGVQFTAAGGGIGPFRYVVLYNDTAAGKPIIGFADYGLSYTLPDTQTFPVDFDPAAALVIG